MLGHTSFVILGHRPEDPETLTMGGWVYIMASKRNGTLYTGVTSDLHRRVAEHKQADLRGFTQRYGCKTLVWHELHNDIETAIQREKNIKRYLRAWKLRLIEALNPNWDDLFAVFSDNDNPFDPSFVRMFEARLDPRDGTRG